MRTFTKIYWGLWLLGLVAVVFAEMGLKAGEGPGMLFFLYFGVTVVMALVYGVVVLIAGRK